MGWNGSASGSATLSPQRDQAPRSPKARRWFVALLVLAMIGGVSAWWYFGHNAVPVTSTVTGISHGKARIPEVTPHIATNRPAPVQKGPTNAERLRAQFPGTFVPDNWDKPYHPKAYWPDGTLKKYSRYIRVITNKTSLASMSIEERTFPNSHAERDIAGALLITPGEELVGEYRYDESFKDSFLASLQDPIVIDKEKDSPEQQELKEAVIEAKKELKQALDRGEDIVALMNETRKQFEELALYREEIKKMVDDARDQQGELSEKDEEDLIGAANLMLEERGCKPLALPHTFVEHAEHL